jgi:hypothetical protein
MKLTTLALLALVATPSTENSCSPRHDEIRPSSGCLLQLGDIGSGFIPALRHVDKVDVNAVIDGLGPPLSFAVSETYREHTVGVQPET